MSASRDFAAAADRMGWPELPGADHTGSWNLDRTHYSHLLEDFLTRTVATR